MTKFVPYLAEEAIERDAEALLAEFAHARAVVIEAPIPFLGEDHEPMVTHGVRSSN